MIHFPVPEALTFDDVLLLACPAALDVIPTQTRTRRSCPRNIRLNIPIISAAMDTVTESHMAIAIASRAASGFIHRNLFIEQQANEVDKVKRSESGMIVDPVAVAPDAKVSEALDVMRQYKISGVPITKKRKAGEHFSTEPRSALRNPLRYSHQQGHDQGKPDHGGSGHDPRRSGKNPSQASRGKTSGGGRQIQPKGLYHGKRHREEDEISATPPKTRTAACAPPPPSAPPETSWSAPRKWPSAKWICWLSTAPTAIQPRARRHQGSEIRNFRKLI